MARSSAHRGPFVIIAEFEVKPNRLEQFLELARTDASHSVDREPGCRQFDVTLDREQPNRVVLYEIYDDEAAFDAHLKTPHLATFRAGIESLIVSRQVRRLTRIHG
jgi:quinol monooxygenase YgiN